MGHAEEREREGGGEGDLPEVLFEYRLSIDSQAKLVASVHWLITRVFDREIPDKLRQIVQLDGEVNK